MLRVLSASWLSRFCSSHCSTACQSPLQISGPSQRHDGCATGLRSGRDRILLHSPTLRTVQSRPAYMDTVAHADHYASMPWNAARDYSRQLTSGTCPTPASDSTSKVESEPEHRKRLQSISRFIRAHHKKMLAREQTYGKFNYYYRVHHHPSNPYLFQEFSALDLKDVRAYDLVLESACYKLKDGHVVKKIVGRTVERIDVR